MSIELPIHEALLRIGWSVLVGAVVGLEREFTQKSAGLRTHILVCMGAAVFTVLSVIDLTSGTLITQDAHFENIHYSINRDPARICAQVVSGIGFIGGGAVLRYGASVRGLTTAASLWLMAALGMLCGSGHYVLSGIVSGVAFLVLFIIGRLERVLFKKHIKTMNRARLLITAEAGQTEHLQEWVEKYLGNELLEVTSTTSPEADITTLTYVVDMQYRGQVGLHRWVQELQAKEGVLSCGVRIYEEELS
jgi:putative Mg2+ transporter-C (MgtC) family protein